jgi:hypothetical protein
MKRIGIVVAVGVFLISPLLLADAPSRIGRAKEVRQAPRIDGKLDEACWGELPPLADFTCVIMRSGPATAQTRAYVGYDRKNLYVGFRCDEPKMELLRSLVSKNLLDPFGESVEIFIDSSHDRNTYYQLRVDVLGRREVRYGMAIDDDFSWRAGAILTETGFTVEAAIPLASLQTNITPGALWGFNVNRQRLLEAPTEFSAWSNTAGGFHAPGKFGLLIFTGYRAFLTSRFENESSALANTLERLYKDYPASTSSLTSLKDDFERIQSEYQERIEAGEGEMAEKDALAALEEGDATIEELEKFLSRLRLEIIKGEFR